MNSSLVERDLWPVFEGHAIVRLFSKMFGSHSFPCQSLLLGINVFNDIHTYTLILNNVGCLVMKQLILYYMLRISQQKIIT